MFVRMTASYSLSKGCSQLIKTYARMLGEARYLSYIYDVNMRNIFKE